MEEDATTLELQVMCKEYEWLLREEVGKVLLDLKSLLSEALRNFRVRSDQVSECHVKPEKFLLSCPSGTYQSKCMVTVVGDLISEADVGVRLQKQPVIIYQTRIYPEMPWKLQQIQDAGNRIQFALSSIDEREQLSSFTSGTQVLSFLDDIISHLKLGRECLSLPKMPPFDELIKNPNNKAFKPPLPQDTIASFFVQAQKLVLAVCHLTSNPQNKTEITSRYQLECSVPWLNDTLLLFTVALHKCQQLKDKVAMFIHYEARLHSLRSGAQKSLDRGSQGDSVKLDKRATSAAKTKTRRQATAGDIPVTLLGQGQVTMN